MAVGERCCRRAGAEAARARVAECKLHAARELAERSAAAMVIVAAEWMQGCATPRGSAMPRPALMNAAVVAVTLVWVAR